MLRGAAIVQASKQLCSPFKMENSVFKSFYVHYNLVPGKLSGRAPRGFTLKVSPDEENPRLIYVQGTWCSNKDEFNKAVGREMADMGERVSYNKRRLPELAASMRAVVDDAELNESEYLYLLKYVV